MLRTILFSLFALVVLMFVARGCGITPEQVEDRILLANMNAEEGAAYRSANRGRDGVVELQGGVQVESMVWGTGPVPRIDDWVIVHYRGMHLDGRVFEDTWRRGDPTTFPIDRTIGAWQAVLPGLPVGSRLRLVVPPEMAYGTAGGGAIGPEETLIFELELLGIAEKPVAPERDPSQDIVPGLR